MRRYPQRSRSAARALIRSLSSSCGGLTLRYLIVEDGKPVNRIAFRSDTPPPRLAPARRPGAAPQSSRSFSQDVLQNLEVERLIRHDPLQPSALLLERLQLPRLAHL